MPTDQNKRIDQKKSVDDSQSKILKNLSARLTDDYFNKKNFPLRTAGIDHTNEVRNIDEYIKKTARKIAGEEEDEDSHFESLHHNPEKFDGVTSIHEEKTLLKEQLKHLERENLKLKHEIDLLKADYDDEMKKTNATIRDLKSELHRTMPLTDNKLFTFSKDLREVVNSVKALTAEELNEDLPELQVDDHAHEEMTPPPVVSIDLPLTNKTLHAEQSSRPKQVVKIDEPKDDMVEEVKSNKKVMPKIPVSKKTKKVILTTTAVAIITFAVGTFALNQKPQVNQKIVDSYLESNGQVQGATSDSVKSVGSAAPTMVKKEQKNNQISFEETKWEVFRDEFLGLQIEYPGNAIDILHTGNTITFLRKEGYLFKAQRLQTDKTLEEYWDSIKANGLQYKVEKTKLNIDEALHLVLDESVEFPGNRYLLKKNGFIYDLWYAVPNPAFDDADMKRVDKMMESLRFL